MEIYCTTEVYIKPKKIFATLFTVCIILTSSWFYFSISEELELIRSQESKLFFFLHIHWIYLHWNYGNPLVWKSYWRIVFLWLKITSRWNEFCVTIERWKPKLFFLNFKGKSQEILAASTEHQVKTGNRWASCIKWPRGKKKKKKTLEDWHTLYLSHFCWLSL